MSAKPDSLQSRLDALADVGPERVVAMVDEALAEGVRRRASDVHFEPTPRSMDVRFRIDGVLSTAATLPAELNRNVVARLKVISDLLTYRTDIPQEGGVRATHPPLANGVSADEILFSPPLGKGGLGGVMPDMRVSTFPTVHGEKAVVRIFQASTPLTDLDQLGLPDDIYKTLLKLLQERSGAVFLTGPSGSGKTTTIYACLHRLLRNSVGRHIVTIEDPVERVVEGISQSQVRPGTEFDFARGLRSLLRQDPDVIMVGEIRDRETAAVAIEAALTGHLVFTTLHAGSAAGVFGRLIEMGIEPYLLTSGIKGILNQRLFRHVCTACRVGLAECVQCHGTGYRGRLLVAELLVPDADFRRAVLARSDTDALEEAARKSGLRTIRAAAEAAVACERTTMVEVERVLGPAHL